MFHDDIDKRRPEVIDRVLQAKWRVDNGWYTWTNDLRIGYEANRNSPCCSPTWADKRENGFSWVSSQVAAWNQVACLPANCTITIRHFVDKSIRVDTYLGGCEYHAGHHYVSCRSVFNNLFAYLLTFVDHLQSLDASFCSAMYIWGWLILQFSAITPLWGQIMTVTALIIFLYYKIIIVNRMFLYHVFEEIKECDIVARAVTT